MVKSMSKTVWQLQLTTLVHTCCSRALVKVLGDHIHQAGSYNCPEYLRFDFNHYEKVTAEQLAEVEAYCE